jgi:C4-dicarboxylate-specific signal transduction histidine kinase
MKPATPTDWPRLATLLGVLPGVALASLLLTSRLGAVHILWLGVLLALCTAGIGAAAWAAFEQVRGRERNLAERERALAAQAEGQAETRRLDLVAQLAAGLAHEIGQPLSAARVTIEGLHYLRQLGRDPGPAYTQRCLDRVGRSILSIAETVEHLRSLSGGRGASAPVPVEVGGAVEAVLGDRDRWLRYQEVVLEWQRPAAVHALADPVGLRLVLVNLLRNAVEAVADQANERRRVTITLHPGAAGDGPVLTVSDLGSGIRPEHLPHLFDPFFTTKAGAVRGVGLSLARASLRAMGGDLAVASDLGAGTTFTVHLAATNS